MENLIKSNTKFSFHFDGNNEIDTVLLVNTINDMAKLAKIAVISENPEAYLKMNVTALKNGSFEICFSAICDYAKTLFDAATAASPLALTAIETVKGYFAIKKHLKGKAPKSTMECDDGRIAIENNDAEVIMVNKASGDIIKNIEIDQLVVNISIYADEHNPEGGCSFSNEKGTLHCSNEDLKQMKKSLPIEECTTCKRWVIETPLLIKKPDILGRSQWGFKFNGKNIDARINDDSFIEYVQKGINITTGDYLDVTLEITIDIDILGNRIEGSEKYIVLKVHGGIQHSLENNTFSF